MVNIVKVSTCAEGANILSHKDNHDVYDRIFFATTESDFTGRDPDDPPLLVALEGDKIIGLLHLSTGQESCVLQYVSVDPAHQNKGIARKLLSEAYDLVAAMPGGFTFDHGDFTVDGDLFLRNIVKEGMSKHPGMLIASDMEQSLNDWVEGIEADAGFAINFH